MASITFGKRRTHDVLCEKMSMERHYSTYITFLFNNLCYKLQGIGIEMVQNSSSRAASSRKRRRGEEAVVTQHVFLLPRIDKEVSGQAPPQRSMIANPLDHPIVSETEASLQQQRAVVPTSLGMGTHGALPHWKPSRSQLAAFLWYSVSMSCRSWVKASGLSVWLLGNHGCLGSLSLTAFLPVPM